MELERLLHQQGFGTRRECRVLVRRGKVLVNGQCCLDPFSDFSASNTVLTIGEITLEVRENILILLNKPVGYECSQKPSQYLSVFSLLPDHFRQRGVQAVGRLDADTSGFLLLTDDGQLNHKLTSPKHHVDKVYRAHSADPIDEKQIKALRSGVLLQGEKSLIAAKSVRLLDANTVEITLSEGKYHQVRRMMVAAGNHVVQLCRTQIGKLSLPADLLPGQWQYVSEEDQKNLFL